MPRLRGGEQARSRKLARELEHAAAEDPSLRPLANQARVLARTVAANRNEVRRLRDVAQGVNGGMNRLVPGGKRLEAGVGKLADATDELSGGLDRLGDGAERLAGGLTELEDGAGALQSGLSEGSRRAYPLQAKLANAGRRVTAVATPLALGAEELRRQSPGLFDSGYFVLSALDGAPAERRAEAGEAISVDGGGQAARMLVVSTHAFNTEGSRRVGERLEADAAGSCGGQWPADRRHRRRRDPQHLRRSDRSAVALGDRRLRPFHPDGADCDPAGAAAGAAHRRP